MKKALIISAVAFTVMACEKEIKLKADEQQSRIVVNSIVNEDSDTIWLSLTESRNLLYEKQLPYLKDADARLYNPDGSEIGKFQFYSSTGEPQDVGYYLPVDGLNVGSTYSLKVSRSGFNAVSSTATIPSSIEINSVDSAGVAGSSSEVEHTIHFKDNGNETNYYALSSVYVEYFVDPTTGDTLISSTATGLSTKEFVAANGNRDIDGATYGEELLFTDDLFNGKDFSFTYQQSIISYEVPSGEEPIPVQGYFDIQLKNISEEYYKYKLSYDKYQSTQDSPFAEPVQVYSNVENGFGLFGGYSSSFYRDH